MHVLALTLGSRGDVQPYIALGTALRAKGHTLTISTGKGFEKAIAEHGLKAAPLSVDIRAMINDPEVQQALRTVSGKIKAWRALKPMVRQILDEMWDISREIRPDLIAYHIKGTAASHIAEALGISAIPTFQIPAMVPTKAFPSPLLPFGELGGCGNWLSHRFIVKMTSASNARLVRDWRRDKLGLTGSGPRNAVDGFDPSGMVVPRLHGYSRHIIPHPDDWGEREEITGYWYLDQTTDWTPPAALSQFLDAGPPPVYIGFGSMPSEDAEALTRLVIEAVTASGKRAVLATGWGGLADRSVPESVHLLDAAPHDWLFPRCAAVVHHGGSGTTHEGLRWGRPSFVCPVFGDQPFWGRRVAMLGAGPPPIAQKKLTSEALCHAIRAMQDPAMIAKAEETGIAMRAEPGAQAAADSLIRYAA